MDTILKFDRVVLTKELNEKIKRVGDVFEIANILDGSFVLRDSKTKTALGVVSFEDFDKHFVKEDSFKGWTPWTPILGLAGQTDAVYRTNRRRVQVRFLTDKVGAEACCCKDDDFNLYLGIQIAYSRCYTKALTKRKEEHERKLKEIKGEIKENNRVLKKLINSLGD